MNRKSLIYTSFSRLVKKIIPSCKTDEQLKVCKNYGNRILKLVRKEFNSERHPFDGYFIYCDFKNGINEAIDKKRNEIYGI